MNIEVKELTPNQWPDLEKLFSASNGCDGCWCFNHHIEPNTPDVRGEKAKEALKKLVLEQKTYGVLAFLDQEPVGWCALDRKIDIPGHDCTADVALTEPNKVWSIHCFYVLPAHQKKGVARALMEKALALLQKYKAETVEGYPIFLDDKTKKTPVGETFSGPYFLFEEYGFQLSEKIDSFYTRMIKKL